MTANFRQWEADHIDGQRPVRNLFKKGKAKKTAVQIAASVITDAGNRTVDTSKWARSNASDTVTTQSSTVLDGDFSYQLNFAANDATGVGRIIESPLFTMPSKYSGKPISISFDVSGVLASGNADFVIVRYNSSGVFQERIAPAGTASAATSTGALLATGNTSMPSFFVSNATVTDQYALRYRALTGVNTAIIIDNIFFGIEPVRLGAAVTDWQAYTGSITGGGTATFTYNHQQYRRVGDSAEVELKIVVGTGGNGSGVVQFPLPAGLNIDAAKTVNDGNQGVYAIVGPNYTLNGYARYFSGGGTSFVVLTKVGTTSAVLGSDLTSGATYTIRFTVPIVGWSSNVTTGDRALEEYAWNTSTSVATDSTSFGYGISGNAFPSGVAGSEFFKTVRFLTPVQQTDALIIEIQKNSGPWMPVNQAAYTNGIASLTYQNGAVYGIGLNLTLVNGTDVTVVFGRYSYSSSTYGSAGVDWSSSGNTGYKWRVRKVSSGAQIGGAISGKNIIPEEVIQPPMTTSTAVNFGVGVRFVNTGTPTTQTLQAITAADDGKRIVIKNVNSGTVTIAASGGSLIDGASTQILNQYESVNLIAFNTNWFII